MEPRGSYQCRAERLGTGVCSRPGTVPMGWVPTGTSCDEVSLLLHPPPVLRGFQGTLAVQADAVPLPTLSCSHGEAPACVRACPATPARVFHRQCVASPQTPPRAGAGQPGSLRRQATSVCTSFPTSTPVAEDYSDFKLASRSFGSTCEMKDSRTHGHHSKVLEGASRAEGHATLHEKGQSLTLVRRVGGDQSSPSDVRSEGGAGRRS